MGTLVLKPVRTVAPYVGAWIETPQNLLVSAQIDVAPYVGAWIETLVSSLVAMPVKGRTLRGCVD